MGEKQNLTINGSGSYGGGTYNKIKIRGDGTITADFDCEVLKTFGSSCALKNGKAKHFDVFGETEVRGNLVCNVMKIFGTTEVGGNASIKKARVFGTLDVGDRFSGEETDIKGTLTVKGDTEFEIFKSTGSFDIKGLLNAGTIEVSLRYGSSMANEIGGDKITVKKKSSFLPFGKGGDFLQAKVIEGDEIQLENTKADVVRGKSVRIGEGCEIGLVEYLETFKVDSDSAVKEKRKISR